MKILDYSNVLDFVTEDEIASLQNEATEALKQLVNKNGVGGEYTGWVDYPVKITDEDIDRILKTTKKIRDESKVLLVIGVGGSYLGAKAAITMLTPHINLDPLKIIFIGNSFSSTTLYEIYKYLDVHDIDFSINIISKSGTTTEPAVAFRIFRNLLKKKYGSVYNKRVYVTTSIGSGALYNLAVENKYEIFAIPEDIGGRYSILTAVGLLPINCAGIDIREIIKGAQEAYHDLINAPFLENDALYYAAIRNLLYRKGKCIEVFAPFEPDLYYLGEWYKQLFGESEGKELKGIYPTSVIYSTDLHSMGQYLQNGSRIMFETFINIMNPKYDLSVDFEPIDFDGLNYLADKSINQINQAALKSTVFAHVSGGVPSLVMNIKENTPYQFGYFVYLMMLACAVSGYLLKVNPFSQDGVETYKRNMFALLGKPGYEKLREELLNKK